MGAARGEISSGENQRPHSCLYFFAEISMFIHDLSLPADESLPSTANELLPRTGQNPHISKQNRSVGREESHQMKEQFVENYY